MPTVMLMANRQMTYATRRLLPGDTFEASARDARILLAMKKVREVRKPAVVPPPPPAVAAKTAEWSAELDTLREEARAAGVAVDMRWGSRRLRQEIDAAKSANPPGAMSTADLPPTSFFDPSEK